MRINTNEPAPSTTLPAPLDPEKLSAAQIIGFHRNRATGDIDTGKLAAFVLAHGEAEPEKIKSRFLEIEGELASKATPFELARFRQDFVMASPVAALASLQFNTSEKTDTSTDAQHQYLGQSMPVLYDGLVRDGYHRTAKANADHYFEKIEDVIRDGGDLLEIEHLSREAFDTRQDLRTQTQGRLTPVGKLVSQAIEKPYTFEDRYSHYESKLLKESGSATDQQVFREVAVGSGKSNFKMDLLAKGGKAVGIVGTAYGIYTAGDAITSAPANERGKVASEQAGAIIGGAGGALAGGALGALGMGLLFSNPVGWAVLGASAVGAGVLGYFGSEAGEKLGGKLFLWANQ